MRLQNKVAFITGGNSGIGLAAAKLFIEQGARVAIAGRNKETLDAAAAVLGPNAIALQTDITDIAATEKAIAAAVEKFGKLDIVFANAGIPGLTPLGSTALAAFEQIVSTNLTSVFFTVQAAVPHMNDAGSIILNGSVLATLGAPGWSAYSATKAGVRALSRVLASELAPRKIRVNVVVPGGTRTPIWSGAAPTDQAMSALEQRLSLSIPFGRMGEADEIAKAALFLASDDSAYITATEIVVDGGATGAPSGAPIYRG